MNPFTNLITRRAILRGAGCALALPWLESFSANAPPPRRRTAAGGCSRKRVEVFFPGAGANGYYGGPGGPARKIKLTKPLPPHEQLKSKANVTPGLLKKGGGGLELPPPQTGGLL